MVNRAKAILLYDCMIIFGKYSETLQQGKGLQIATPRVLESDASILSQSLAGREIHSLFWGFKIIHDLTTHKIPSSSKGACLYYFPRKVSMSPQSLSHNQPKPDYHKHGLASQ